MFLPHLDCGGDKRKIGIIWDERLGKNGQLDPLRSRSLYRITDAVDRAGAIREVGRAPLDKSADDFSMPPQD
jgi:hypothetical protein